MRSRRAQASFVATCLSAYAGLLGVACSSGAGVSSEPDASPQTAEAGDSAGPPAMGLDDGGGDVTDAPPVVPLDTGTGQDSGDAPPAIPDAGPGSDVLSPPDGGLDAPQGVDAETDAADASDEDVAVNAVDASPMDAADAETLEETRCMSGAPRLIWQGQTCFDANYNAACVFRQTSGLVRCLPAPSGSVAGYPTNACFPGNQGYLDSTLFDSSAMFVSVNIFGLYFEAHDATVVPRPGANTWYTFSGGCPEVATPFPYVNADGHTLVAGATLDDTLFVAAP